MTPAPDRLVAARNLLMQCRAVATTPNRATLDGVTPDRAILKHVMLDQRLFAAVTVGSYSSTMARLYSAQVMGLPR
jgi:hypothetical protein